MQILQKAMFKSEFQQFNSNNAAAFWAVRKVILMTHFDDLKVKNVHLDRIAKILRSLFVLIQQNKSFGL